MGFEKEMFSKSVTCPNTYMKDAMEIYPGWHENMVVSTENRDSYEEGTNATVWKKPSSKPRTSMFDK